MKKPYEINGRSIPEILQELTVEEKANLCCGKTFWDLYDVPRLGIPSIMVSDGPHGLRKQAKSGDNLGLSGSVPATCFPTAVTTASSWDPDLLYEMGQAIGEEALQQKLSVVLGPGVNMKRSPLCGRNFEYMSEDPYLAGELASAYINGVQSQGVGTSMKHFAANNQETRRLSGSSVVDERTLREIYLPAFEAAVKQAQPWTVMNAYNQLNSIHCSENAFLQDQILRNEWGFDGIVVSDWGAVNDRVLGVKNGNDLEMPTSQGYNAKNIVDAVYRGQLELETLDRRVAKLLELIAKSMPALEETHSCDYRAHHRLARKIAGQSMVLLKNENNVLPLQKKQKLAVIGQLARKMRYQGAGSSKINPTQIDNACDCLGQAGFLFRYAPGYRMSKKSSASPATLRQNAVDLAKQSDAVLLFVGLTDEYESEGFDRTDLHLPREHDDLVRAVSAVNPNVVVVLFGGSPVEMPWLHKVPAVLNAYLGGQAGAGAIVDIISGNVNPSGKLAETYPQHLSDTPSFYQFPGDLQTVEYRESIYIGYRYYDKMQKPVNFPFGHGLSYTTFAYSDLAVDKTKLLDSDTLTVRFTVQNTGSVAGAEVAQLYVHDQESTIFRAPKELKGFHKVYLEPGESKEIELQLAKRAFAYYNVDLGDWHVESGKFDLLVGASSQDIRLKKTVTVTSTVPVPAVPDYRESAPVYYDGDPQRATEEDLEALLGHPLPPTRKDPDAPITQSDTFETAAHTPWGRRIGKLIDSVASKLPEGEMVAASAKQAPFRLFVTMSGCAFTPEMLEGLLRVLNGDRPGTGFWKIIKGLPQLVARLSSLF